MQFRTIGVLGGGQLGRMMAIAGQRMGLKIAILDPDPEAPAGQVANRHVIGDFRDPAKIRELAAGCDILTVEIEHVETATLEALEKEGIPVQPSPATIRLIQDKFAQKQHLAVQGLPVGTFREVRTVDAIEAAGAELGYPLLLKSKRLAYDGRGNAVIRDRGDILNAIAALSGAELYVEAWVPFVKELAVMVARGLDSSIRSYPVVETIQRDNICHTVTAPAAIPEAVAQRARTIAEQAIGTLSGAGIYGVELFLLPDDRILVNEIAPRPHNSGHYTIEACATSQFEQHLRAILGLPLGATDLIVDSAMMINILGKVGLEETTRPLDLALTIPGATGHWYGKANVRPGRKMGHLTITAASRGELAERIKPLSEVLGVQLDPAPLVGIIMGSDSDLPTMKVAAAVLQDFGIPFELTIVSAHRTPDRMFEYARNAHGRGLRAIIAGAGGAAHLPGMVAALTPLPVIGVPIQIEPLDGQDALFSIVQMPRGVPVATVAIGNATNAGLLAVRLLAAHDRGLLDKMIAYQTNMKQGVLDKVEALNQVGWENYKR
jgi:phosphoribosylaminoimidazole carboxylase